MQIENETGFLDQVRCLGYFDNLLWIEPFLTRTFKVGQVVEVKYGWDMQFEGKFTVRMIGKRFIWTDEVVNVRLGDYLLVTYPPKEIHVEIPR